MSKDWGIILRFAALGLAIAAGIYTYFAFFAVRSTDLDILVGKVSLILCPPSLLCLWYCSHDVVTGPSIAIWSVIGPLNAALYGLISAAYVGLRKKPDESVTK